MKDFVTSSALTRLLANVFVFVVLLGAVFVLIYQIIHDNPISPICYSVVSAGLTYAIMLLGVHTGAQLPGVIVKSPGNIVTPEEENI